MSAMTADAGDVAQRSFREVWVISLGHALTHWYPATFYLLLPLIGKELGLDYAQIGSILTANTPPAPSPMCRAAFWSTPSAARAS